MSLVPFTGALAPLANRDFRYLLAGFAIGQMLMPLQFITQILWVQHYAPQDVWLILVALIAACRGLGAFSFGLYGGALADRFDRRNLLRWILLLQLIGTLGVSLLMYLSIGDVLGFSLFFLLIFLTSGLQSIDAPTRLAIVPDVLGMQLSAAGISLNQVATQIAMPVAMIFTGVLVAGFGFAGAYLFSAIALIVAIICLSLMDYRPSASVAERRGQRYGFAEAFQDVRFGLAYAQNHRVVLWVILLMVVMMGLGYPPTASLGPTWVTKFVGIEIANMGFYVAFWGFGSLAAAVVMARLASYRNRGRLLVIGAVLFSLSFLVFVADASPINVVIGNFGLGAGMTITSISSIILIQHLVPNEVRGRIMSILQLNMAFAQLMTMPVAILGQWLTLPVLFPILALATLILVAVIAVTQTQVVTATIEKH